MRQFVIDSFVKYATKDIENGKYHRPCIKPRWGTLLRVSNWPNTNRILAQSIIIYGL